MRNALAGVGLSVVLLLAVACGGGEKERGRVAISLREWEVSAAPAEVKPGEFVLDVANSGTREHELVVVKSDLPPTQLPLVELAVDEAKVNISGRVEKLAAGASGTLELELFPGKYLLICNILDTAPGGVAEPHYLNGMVLSFLVLDR